MFNSIRRIKLNKLMMIERRDEKNIKNISFFLFFFNNLAHKDVHTYWYINILSNRQTFVALSITLV